MNKGEREEDEFFFFFGGHFMTIHEQMTQFMRQVETPAIFFPVHVDDKPARQSRLHFHRLRNYRLLNLSPVGYIKIQVLPSGG